TPQRAVIGIGINVNNSFESAPDDVRRRAVALIDRLGRREDRTAVLVDVLDELADMLDQLEDDTFSLAAAFAPHCLLTDKIVTVQTPGRTAGQNIVGLCRGIGEDGRLQIQTPTALEQIAAGVIADWQ
ncbi:MAG TPA: hypothetical protein PLV92_20550, partial [Pirellulaceae bacterium]|nr:hypothetical protein [Pirellulaceae bacterium]